jgi:hypothetical protein
VSKQLGISRVVLSFMELVNRPPRPVTGRAFYKRKIRHFHFICTKCVNSFISLLSIEDRSVSGSPVSCALGRPAQIGVTFCVIAFDRSYARGRSNSSQQICRRHFRGKLSSRFPAQATLNAIVRSLERKSVTSKRLTELTPWPESASALYRLSDRRLSAKFVPAFANRGCHVVSATDPHGCIIRFLYRHPKETI